MWIAEVIIFVAVLIVLVIALAWREFKNAQKSIRANEENGKEGNNERSST